MAIYTGSNRHLGGAETVAQRQTVFYGLVQKNVLVTGAKGQLGQQLLQLESRINTPFRFLYTDTDELDITDAGAVHRFVAENHVDYIINCAAYTAVDKAETDEAAACLVNLTGAENLARTGAKIIRSLPIMSSTVRQALPTGKMPPPTRCRSTVGPN